MTWCTDYLGSRLPRITCEASRLDAEGGRVEEATQFGLDDFGPAKKSSSWPDVHRLPCFNLQQINLKNVCSVSGAGTGTHDLLKISLLP